MFRLDRIQVGADSGRSGLRLVRIQIGQDSGRSGFSRSGVRWTGLKSERIQVAQGSRYSGFRLDRIQVGQDQGRSGHVFLIRLKDVWPEASCSAIRISVNC